MGVGKGGGLGTRTQGALTYRGEDRGGCKEGRAAFGALEVVGRGRPG